MQIQVAHNQAQEASRASVDTGTRRVVLRLFGGIVI